MHDDDSSGIDPEFGVWGTFDRATIIDQAAQMTESSGVAKGPQTGSLLLCAFVATCSACEARRPDVIDWGAYEPAASSTHGGIATILGMPRSEPGHFIGIAHIMMRQSGRQVDLTRASGDMTSPPRGAKWTFEFPGRMVDVSVVMGGRSAACLIEGQRFLLDEGNMFVVDLTEGGEVATQIKTIYTDAEDGPNHARILELYKSAGY